MALSRCRRWASAALVTLVAAVAASAALGGASAGAARNGKLTYTSLQSASQLAGVYPPNSGAIPLFDQNDFAEFAPVASPDRTRVAFVSTRDGNYEIYVRNIDRTGGLTRLTTHPAEDEDPAWSPDSQRIAFASARDGGSEIYVVGADGTGLTKLTSYSRLTWSPSWSPDGTRIAFSSSRDGDFDVYVMNADGTGVTQLTSNSDADDFPAWSPDGTRIAFTSNRDGDDEIYVMNPDGTGVVQLTSTQEFAGDWDPAWSFDSRRIAFTSDRDGNPEIYSMNADGTAQRNVTQLPGTSEFEAGWTWDGRVLFDSDFWADMAVEAVSSSGAQRRTLYPSIFDDLLPRWSPDGKRVAFVSLRDGRDLEIFVGPASGRSLVQLTNNRDVQDVYPAWSPDGGRIAFVRFNADGTTTLQTMNAAGGGVRFVLEGDDLCCPAWSPDGSWLALSRDGDIAVVRLNGRGLRVLTGAGTNSRPSWSPDGEAIVFDSDRGGGTQIYRVSARGGPVRRLTQGRGPNWAPDWSPDGQLIAFSNGDLRSVTAEIYVMRPNGAGIQHIPLPVPAVIPDWQPVK